MNRKIAWVCECMNILLLTPYLEQKKGPIVWAKNFAQKLSEKDVNLFVLTFNENTSDNYDFYHFTHYGYNIERKILKYPFLSIITKIIFIEKRYNIDIVQTNDPLLAFGALLAKKITKIPVVLRTGGKYFDELDEQCKKHCNNLFGNDSNLSMRIASYSLKNLGTYTMKKVDHVVAVNDYMSQYLKSYGIISCIIPNAVDVTTFDAPKISTQENYLFTISNMTVPNKVEGIKLLLKSMSLLKKKYPNVKLKIAGEGNLRASLEEYSKKQALENNVEFMGYQNQIPFLLSSCSIYVHSSLQDVFPNAILEAMASKKPVIATNVGGIPEIIKNNYDGIICDPNSEEIASAIIKVFNDQNFRDKIIKNGYSTVLVDYSWDKAIDSYLNLYNKMQLFSY